MTETPNQPIKSKIKFQKQGVLYFKSEKEPKIYLGATHTRRNLQAPSKIIENDRNTNKITLLLIIKSPGLGQVEK
jgi:hypothetical protein